MGQRLHFLLAVLAPVAFANQVLLETRHRITQRELLPFILWPVTRRIVAGGVRATTVSHEFNQRWAVPLAGALGGPQRH